MLEYYPQGFMERTGNICRAQGRRARLEFKHFVRHVMTETILHPEVIPSVIVEAIGEHGVTHAFFVPAVLQFLLATPEIADTDMSTLELIGYGASPITEKDRQFWSFRKGAGPSGRAPPSAPRLRSAGRSRLPDGGARRSGRTPR